MVCPVLHRIANEAHRCGRASLHTARGCLNLQSMSADRANNQPDGESIYSQRGREAEKQRGRGVQTRPIEAQTWLGNRPAPLPLNGRRGKARRLPRRGLALSKRGPSESHVALVPGCWCWIWNPICPISTNSPQSRILPLSSSEGANKTAQC